MERRSVKCVTLDASTIGDFPARYTVSQLEPHQFPAVGVYVDKRILPGFKYRVRPLSDPYDVSNKKLLQPLFNGKALTLKAIGRGYARRLTFETVNDKSIEHFWSDNRPEGYAFEIEAVTEGDKFTVYEVDNEPQGTAEVLKIEVMLLFFILN